MSIEQELFNWDGWDGDQECMVFYNPLLKMDIGKFPMGTRFDSASITQTKDGCLLELNNFGAENEDGDGTVITRGTYRLHYKIGETLQEN